MKQHAREAEAIYKADLVRYRLAGKTDKWIAKKFGIHTDTVREWAEAWLRDALRLNPEAADVIVASAVARYDEVIRTLWPHVVADDGDEGVKGPDVHTMTYHRLAKLLIDVIEKQVGLVRGPGTGREPAVDLPGDLEGEAEKCGLVA